MYFFCLKYLSSVSVKFIVYNKLLSRVTQSYLRIQCTEISFWWKLWLDGETLKSKFIRLYDLVDNKMATVADMNSLGLGGGW